MVVPLTARGVTLGLAGFSRAEHPEPYDEADVRLVSDLAARPAVDIDNAQLYAREHDTAVTLQRSLLPRDIPPMPGLDIAYRYQPASRAAQAGGDWFDVIPLDGGQAALVVGDVTGHGIHVAAIMGQLRTTTAALVRLGCPPDQIMTQLSGVVAAHGDEAGATCLYAMYDPASRQCRLTSAGHLPPALRHPGGRVEFLDVPGGVMLGAGRDRSLPPISTGPRAACWPFTPTGSSSSRARTSAPACPGSPARWPPVRRDRWTTCATACWPAWSPGCGTTSPCCSPTPPPRPPTDRRTAPPLPVARRVLLPRRAQGRAGSPDPRPGTMTPGPTPAR
ncbi:MAG TPA: GAF domain-containing SpoIIE family protein phosphatase [Streptosporangiaceae bacterium]|nr:GAF domain-containing SpoIIE family protein phosphatase [Streptosporangiaceae bacterium]